MPDTAISIENISKTYRLGLIGSGTLREDLQGWWHRVRGLPDPNLRVDQVHQAIEGHTLWALQEVTLAVKQGEVLGIIGRNGAGKSTLLKILSRVTAPTSGRIRVKGRVASLLEVGTGFHPELTGRENIFLNGAILGMTKAEVARKFDEIVAFSEIEQFIDTPVKRYSSGMYVRLAFAVAAHLDPEILVVDEVLAVGDAEFQKKCLGKLGSVAGEGRTVLFVSHNMQMVKTLCGRAVLLDKGRVLLDGAAEKVVMAYSQKLEAGPAHAGDKTWVAGDDTVRLDHARISGADGEPKDTFSITEEVVIRVGLTVLRKVEGALLCSLEFRTPDGLYVFSLSHPARHDPEPGRYEVECRLPARFLNDIEYVVGIDVYTSRTGTVVAHVREPGWRMITCKDHLDGTRYDFPYRGHVAGVVRPLLFQGTMAYRGAP